MKRCLWQSIVLIVCVLLQPVSQNCFAGEEQVSSPSVYVVQRKAFLRTGKLELTPMFSTSFSDQFVQTLGVSGSLSWHLSEVFALELFGGYLAPSESELTQEINRISRLQPEFAKLTQLLWAAGVGVQWSPIYGKIRLFNKSLGNFAFYLGLGGGIGQTRVQCTQGERLDPQQFGDAFCPRPGGNEIVYEPEVTRFVASVSGGARVDIRNWLAIKVELRDYVFATRTYRPDSDDATLTDTIKNNLFLQMGLSFLFFGPSN